MVFLGTAEEVALTDVSTDEAWILLTKVFFALALVIKPYKPIDQND